MIANMGAELGATPGSPQEQVARSDAEGAAVTRPVSADPDACEMT